MSPPYKAIVFDIDGVLLHLTAAETRSFVGSFAQCFGIDGIDENWNAYKKRNDVEIAKEILANRFGRSARPEELALVREAYLADLRDGLAIGRIVPEVLPGVRETLEALAAHDGLCLSIATANLAAAAELRLRHVGLWHHFHCGGFAETGDTKTATLSAVREFCRDHLGTAIAPDDMLFLGDQPSDVQAAQVNGTAFIGIAADHRGHRRLASAGAARILPRLSYAHLAPLLE